MINPDNICHFIPYRQEGDRLNIIHYVLETHPQVNEGFKCLAMNRIHLVTQGCGKFHTSSASYDLKAGDLFFILPAMPYAIESGAQFQYTYISFLGGKGNAFIDKIHISSANCVFHGFSHLCDLWTQGLNVTDEMSDLRSEGILLYTFSLLGDVFFASLSKETDTPSLAIQMRNYIDNHLEDTTLSLKTISEALLYNPKYLSTSFKSVMKIGVSEYITTLRIQQACTLMNQGFTSIKDIASLCGFKDPLYFSKVFRRKIGMTPKEYQKDSINSPSIGSNAAPYQ